MNELCNCKTHDKEIILFCVTEGCSNKFNCISCLQNHYKLGHEPEFVEKRYVFGEGNFCQTTNNGFTQTSSSMQKLFSKPVQIDLAMIVDHYKHTFKKVQQEKSRDLVNEMMLTVSEFLTSMTSIFRETSDNLTKGINKNAIKLIEELNKRVEDQEENKLLNTEYFLDTVLYFEKELTHAISIIKKVELRKKESKSSSVSMQPSAEEDLYANLFSLMKTLKTDLLDKTDKAIDNIGQRDSNFTSYIEGILKIKEKYFLQLNEMMNSIEDEMNTLLDSKIQKNDAISKLSFTNSSINQGETLKIKKESKQISDDPNIKIESQRSKSRESTTKLKSSKGVGPISQAKTSNLKVKNQEQILKGFEPCTPVTLDFEQLTKGFKAIKDKSYKTVLKQFKSGRLLVDPLDDPSNFRIYFYTENNRNLLFLFTSYSSFLTAKPSKVISLPFHISNMGSFIYSNNLFCFELDTLKFLKYSLIENKEAFKSNLSLLTDDYSLREKSSILVNLAEMSRESIIMNSGSDLIILGSCLNGNACLIRVNPIKPKISEIIEIDRKRNLFECPFIVNNKIYHLKNSDIFPTSITYCYDITQKTNVSNFLIPFDNLAKKTSSISYINALNSIVNVDGGQIYEYKLSLN